MSKPRKVRVHVWRGWCPGCKSYLAARTPDPRAVEAVECPDCKRRVPACRGTVYQLAGDKVVTRAFWPEKPKG